MIFWLSSFPRSGNTLARTIFKQIFGISTYSIYENQDTPQTIREILETVGATPFKGSYVNFIEFARKSSKPTIIKTHHGPESDDPAIYIVRNGLVATDSYRHYLKVFQKQSPDWSTLIKGAASKMPTWSQHLDTWNPINRPKTLIIKYEDLVSKQANSQITAIGRFCGLKANNSWRNPWKKMHHVGPNFFRRGRPTVPPEITVDEVEAFLKTANNRKWMEYFKYETQPPFRNRIYFRLKKMFPLKKE
jgi:hypothetical protein